MIMSPSRTTALVLGLLWSGAVLGVAVYLQAGTLTTVVAQVVSALGCSFCSCFGRNRNDPSY